MGTLRRVLGCALLVVALAVGACSPEANRERGGGRGADIGNRPSDPAAVEIHGETNPEHDVPAVGDAIRKESGAKK